MMEQVLIVFTIVTAVIGMITFVSTSVWAVAQVKETTSNLGIKIENLAKTIDKMATEFDSMKDRLAAIEKNQ